MNAPPPNNENDSGTRMQWFRRQPLPHRLERAARRVLDEATLAEITVLLHALDERLVLHAASDAS